jgi:hypothetical protein
LKITQIVILGAKKALYCFLKNKELIASYRAFLPLGHNLAFSFMNVSNSQIQIFINPHLITFYILKTTGVRIVLEKHYVWWMIGCKNDLKDKINFVIK